MALRVFAGPVNGTGTQLSVAWNASARTATIVFKGSTTREDWITVRRMLCSSLRRALLVFGGACMCISVLDTETVGKTMFYGMMLRMLCCWAHSVNIFACRTSELLSTL